MKKYTYKVLKEFSIVHKDGESEILSGEEIQRKGSTFQENAEYFDYAFPGKGLGTSDVTDELLDKGYIEFVSKKVVE